MNSHTTHNLTALAGLCKKAVFVVSHVARNGGCAFATDSNTGESVYIHASYIDEHSLHNGDLIECVVVPNTHGKRDDTPWRCISMKHLGSMHSKEEIVHEPEPEVPLEDRVFEIFEEHPDQCFTTREICDDVLHDQGVNSDVRTILVRLHNVGDICQMTIKTKGTNKKGFVYWGLNPSSFIDVDESEASEDLD